MFGARLILVLVIAGSFACFGRDSTMPDAALTPGAIMTNVTVEMLSVRGYSNNKVTGVRNVSESTKRKVFVRYYGRVPDRPGDYEIDHLISLEIGGSNEIENLWPEPYSTGLRYNAHVKDALENHLAAMVKNDLKQNGHDHATDLLHRLQREIATDWIAAYKKYVGKGQANKVTE